MPASQLKRLKASLREQGITGQQKSKKQKLAHRLRPTSERVERSAALQQIRDSSNPFELRQPARPAKFATANARTTTNGKAGKYKDVLYRPGVTRSAGEEMRRATLLPEMHKRNKTGGLVDRRIGEGDADMTPEEKAAQRFARAQSKRKGADLFNLEASDDDEIPGDRLTHGGRSINDLEADDFRENMSDGSDEGDFLTRKRAREVDIVDEPAVDEPDQPERKKSRKEVMEEVIAKSKYHKYERQKAKEDDDDLREELDKDMPDILALLNGRPNPIKHVPATDPSEPPRINPDRQRLIDGMDRRQLNQDYDKRMRELAQDTRAKPSDRAKTEEEKAADEAERLRELEENRQKRMRGEDVEEDGPVETKQLEGYEDIVDEAAAFGLQANTFDSDVDKMVHPDEDEFALDEDLIASDSEGESDVDDSASDRSYDSESSADEEADEEDEFIRGILGDAGNAAASEKLKSSAQSIAYTYPCPQTHAELLDVLEDTPSTDLPTIVQRIRALHHPSLSAANNTAMATFSAVLVDHIAYLASDATSLIPIEQVTRHIHSLSRTYPTEIADAFRKHLSAFYKRGPPVAGDLVVLAAIGSIYPTSDHFHQVVTPAMTLMAKYLGLTAPTTAHIHATGTYFVKLVLQYQRLSKRYVPEAAHFTLRALSAKTEAAVAHRSAHLSNLIAMAQLWREQSAFSQIFAPFVPLLTSLSARKELQTLQILLGAAKQRNRPLELHHHKPMPIRTSIPKFEEGFNPDKHYDPDKERSEARKLQKEYKRERKGALRELRKDANFMAREQLRDKKERDAAYEKKYRRLVAEIQGEEGHEAKEYEREKKARKRAKR